MPRTAFYVIYWHKNHFNWLFHQQQSLYKLRNKYFWLRSKWAQFLIKKRKWCILKLVAYLFTIKSTDNRKRNLKPSQAANICTLSQHFSSIYIYECAMFVSSIQMKFVQWRMVSFIIILSCSKYVCMYVIYCHWLKKTIYHKI